MSRPRLRFLLQEIDLRDGETLVGRSAHCHVTIEDPLVSRQHARLLVTRSGTTIEDLDSRNGTLVNGRAIRAAVELRDGDRIRIGTLELVYSRASDRVAEPRIGRRTTGFLCHCAECSTTYPAESACCPQCGSRQRVDDETLSGIAAEGARNVAFDVLVEVLEQTVAARRWDDVERLLRRARATVETHTATGEPVDPGHLDRVGQAAIWLAVERGQSDWAGWVLTIYSALQRVPGEAVLQPIDLMPEPVRNELALPADRLARAIAASGGPAPDEVPSFVRIRALRGQVEA